MSRSTPAGRRRCRRRTSRARSSRPIPEHKAVLCRCKIGIGSHDRSGRPWQGTEVMKAGFIGLATMGASMAANLQNGIQKLGHMLLVHDVRRETAAPHIKNGAV